MRIQYLADNYWGSTWYRCHVPGMELKRLGHDVVLTDDVVREEIETADVLVLQRMYQTGFIDLLPHLRERGTRVVYDIDDDYWNIRPENPAYDAWRDGTKLETLVQIMRKADLVTVPTRVLAERVRALGMKAKVLPNMLPAEHWKVEPRAQWDPNSGAPLVIGWAASGSHRADIPIIADVIVQMLDRNSHAEFHVAGISADMLPDHPRVRILESVRIEDYPKLINAFDIAIAPLLDNRFNQAKSDLKLIEYGMCSLPVIATPVGAYVDVGRNGDNVLFAKNAKDWIRHLNALITRPELRQTLGASLHLLSTSRLIEDHIGKWADAYGIGDTAAGVG